MNSYKIKKDTSLTAQHKMVIDIFHTANFLEEKITEILRNFDLTHQQYNILKNVYSASPDAMSVAEISETTMFKNSDVTRLLDRLVRKELLNRETCKMNRRKVDITVSSTGKAMVEQIQPLLNEAFNGRYVFNIADSDAENTREILRKIRRNK